MVCTLWAGMTLLGGKKMKLLYVLALFQLVAGPLMLMQVTVFCKMVVKESPRQGVAAAFEKSWSSEEFQAVLASPDPLKKGDAQSPQPAPEQKLKVEKKMPLMAWQAVVFLKVLPSARIAWVMPERLQYGVWPQAPPAPPPRVG